MGPRGTQFIAVSASLVLASILSAAKPTQAATSSDALRCARRLVIGTTEGDLAESRQLLGNSLHPRFQEAFSSYRKDGDLSALAQRILPDDWTVSDTDRQKVEATISDNPAASLEQVSQVAWEAYFQARTRGMDPAEVESLVHFIQERIQVQALTGSVLKDLEINGSYDSARDLIQIEIPKDLIGTPVYGRLLAHELEHRIQTARGILTVGKRTYSRLTRFDQIWSYVYRFAQEAQAMQAEYRYMSLVPKQHREQLVQLIQNYPRLPQTLQEQQIANFASTANGELAYLSEQWGRQRYSMKNLMEQIPSSVLPAPWPGLIARYGIYVTLCNLLEARTEENWKACWLSPRFVRGSSAR